MKTKSNCQKENLGLESVPVSKLPIERAKEITEEEGIIYTDEELKQILQFVANVVSITSSHYERTKQKEAIIVNINTNTTHETKSLPLHSGEHRRAS